MTAAKPKIDEQMCVYSGCDFPHTPCIGNCKRITEAAGRPEPVAWLVQYRDRHEFTFKKPAFLIDAIAEPLYGPDLLAYADRVAAERDMEKARADVFDTCQPEQDEGNGPCGICRQCYAERAETAERQLAELQAKHDGLVKDAERFRALQNMEPVKAQQFFWNYSSRKQRAAAIDAAMSAVALREGEE